MTKNKTSTKKGTSTEKKVHVDNSKVHTLDKRISSLESEKEELKKTIQFVQAEFENYKKRQDRDFDNRVNLSSSNIITKILPILDDFEHSISNMKSQNNTTDETIQGVEIIYNNILNILNKEGLESINCENEKFDPYLHEAVLQEESDKESMTVLEVMQKGYKINGKIIRHARVKVAK